MQSEDIDAWALISKLESITISDNARHPQLSGPRLPKVGEDEPACLVPPGLGPGCAPSRALDRLSVRPQRICLSRGEGPMSRRQEYPGIVIGNDDIVRLAVRLQPGRCLVKWARVDLYRSYLELGRRGKAHHIDGQTRDDGD